MDFFPNLETWKVSWRNGVAKVLSDKELVALKSGLQANDPRLCQGLTTMPPPLLAVADWPCEAGCAIVYGYMVGERDGSCTVGEAEERFAQVAYETDQRLGEPAAVRFFLNHFDDTPREEMRRELLDEVNLELEARRLQEGAIAA